jgi:hypothetical protein
MNIVMVLIIQIIIHLTQLLLSSFFLSRVYIIV